MKIDDGEWHVIQVRRRKRMGFISVDGEPALKGVSDSGAISLSTNSKLWIGKYRIKKLLKVNYNSYVSANYKYIYNCIL